MTELERYRNLVFCGVQTFGGKSEPLGIFQDPVTESSFAVKFNEPIGPQLERLKEIWGEEKLGNTLDDPEAIKDLLSDREHDDR